MILSPKPNLNQNLIPIRLMIPILMILAIILLQKLMILRLTTSRVTETVVEESQAVRIIDNSDVVDRLVETLSKEEAVTDSAGQYLGYLAAEETC